MASVKRSVKLSVEKYEAGFGFNLTVTIPVADKTIITVCDGCPGFTDLGRQLYATILAASGVDSITAVKRHTFSVEVAVDAFSLDHVVALVVSRVAETLQAAGYRVDPSDGMVLHSTGVITQEESSGIVRYGPTKYGAGHGVSFNLTVPLILRPISTLYHGHPDLTAIGGKLYAAALPVGGVTGVNFMRRYSIAIDVNVAIHDLDAVIKDLDARIEETLRDTGFEPRALKPRRIRYRTKMYGARRGFHLLLSEPVTRISLEGWGGARGATRLGFDLFRWASLVQGVEKVEFANRYQFNCDVAVAAFNLEAVADDLAAHLDSQLRAAGYDPERLPN